MFLKFDFEKADSEAEVVSFLSDKQKEFFLNEMATSRKKLSTARLWCLFTGGIGGHLFYLGGGCLPALYLIFCWTGIPLVWSLFVELIFLMPRYVESSNLKTAKDVAKRAKETWPDN